jgi:hypothetical protein
MVVKDIVEKYGVELESNCLSGNKIYISVILPSGDCLEYANLLRDGVTFEEAIRCFEVVLKRNINEQAEKRLNG